MTLTDYVIDHTERGECRCGKCFDRGDNPDPTGHSVDLVFFPIAAKNSPSALTFRELVGEHKGCYGDVDPLDGEEHTYLELGGWIGDQGLAMQFMGLGTLLGVFDLMTPKNMLPGISDEQALEIAGMGLLSVKAVRPNS